MRLGPIVFSGYSYSHTIVCCGYLTSNQTLLINTTVTYQKSNLQNSLLYSEKQNN